MRFHILVKSEQGAPQAQAGGCAPALEEGERTARIAALREQMVGLAGQRRSSLEFRPWKADMFYYLFAAIASVLVCWLAGVSLTGLSLRGIATSGMCFGVLCAVPAMANRFCFWVGFRRPNRRLRRQIAVLQAEVERLQGNAK